LLGRSRGRCTQCNNDIHLATSAAAASRS
jgi:hypothetical protein